MRQFQQFSTSLGQLTGMKVCPGGKFGTYK
jgi:hypothetical protein